LLLISDFTLGLAEQGTVFEMGPSDKKYKMLTYKDLDCAKENNAK